jgi:hypothetical protein
MRRSGISKVCAAGESWLPSILAMPMRIVQWTL